MSSNPAADFRQRRFQSAAAHYLAGRPPYPPSLVELVVRRLDITASDRLLDLGCGPANLAIAFAPYAAEVGALDPEPAMLALATEATRAVANVRVQAGRASDVTDRFGRFRAALIGRAFHWMDRDDTLARLDRILDPGGAVVLFDDECPKIPQNAWRRAYDDIVARYAQDDEDRRWRKSDAWVPHVAVLLRSAFCRIETAGVIVSQKVTADMLVERALSLSSTSRARLGARAAEMVADLRTVVSGWETATPVEVIEWTAIVARRT